MKGLFAIILQYITSSYNATCLAELKDITKTAKLFITRVLKLMKCVMLSYNVLPGNSAMVQREIKKNLHVCLI